LNGDKINMTMYYVLSHVPSLIHEFGRPKFEKTVLENLLYFPDRCYEGHHTLYVELISQLFCRSLSLSIGKKCLLLRCYLYQRPHIFREI